jgi:hypothetical protein
MRNLYALSLGLWLLGVPGCSLLRGAEIVSRGVDCARARSATIDTLRDLGYAVAGVYDPMPGRLTIVAAEKPTTRGQVHASVSISCDGNRADVTPAQPALAKHDPHFEADFHSRLEQRIGRSAEDTAPVASADPQVPKTASDSAAAQPLPSPSLRFTLLSGQETRDRFGADITAAGLVVGQLSITNRSSRAYVLSAPLLTLRRANDEAAGPLQWADASARLAKSSAGGGRKAYEDVSREIVTDQVIQPDASVSGILLYPAANYTRFHFILLDQQTARNETFEAALSPGR